MRRIRALTDPLVLAALFATTPQLAFGHEGHKESPIEIQCRKCIVGNEIASGKLGEFIAKNLSVHFETDMRPLSVKLRLEMISREKGVVGKYESKAVEVEPGKTYSGETWMVQRDRHEASFPDVGADVVLIITDFLNDRECEDATHAVRLALVLDGRLFWEPNKPINFICLNVER